MRASINQYTVRLHFSAYESTGNVATGGDLTTTTHHFIRHHVEEVGEVDGSGTLSVDVCDHFFDFLLLWFEAKRSHGDLCKHGTQCAMVVRSIC